MVKPCYWQNSQVIFKVTHYRKFGLLSDLEGCQMRMSTRPNRSAPVGSILKSDLWFNGTQGGSAA